MLYIWLPDLRRILLVAPLRPRAAEDEAVLRERYATFLAPGARPTHEDVGRVCRRSYPSIVVYDEEVWMRIQANADANLALSPEEESVLESVMTPDQDDARYPLFINGRPGSGKSTVLQYLFSEYLTHAIENGGARIHDGPPLYLTYSDALLDRAKTVCRSILHCGAKQAAKSGGTSDENRIDTLLDVAFRNMKDYLLERLPSEERRRYGRDSYVTFARFRREWNRARGQLPQPDVRRIDPDLAWHAIRTYIKGMTLETDGPMDPEYYEQELARDRRTLRGDTFRLIHKHVWERWYLSRCEQDGWWDDQDLALAVLQSAAPLARHSVVFCDESQDFTNLELELIERLSLFSERQLEPHQLRDVPYAFAGDPFQTLNPTGFDWGATQASFHDNIVRLLDPHGRGKLRFNFQELSFNYRSSEHIVRLTNLVQLLRARMFGLKSILPQHTWSRRESISPFYYDCESAEARAALRDQEDLVLIVPCQEGDEEQYVKEDPFPVRVRHHGRRRHVAKRAEPRPRQGARVRSRAPLPIRRPSARRVFRFRGQGRGTRRSAPRTTTSASSPSTSSISSTWRPAAPASDSSFWTARRRWRGSGRSRSRRRDAGSSSGRSRARAGAMRTCAGWSRAMCRTGMRTGTTPWILRSASSSRGRSAGILT